MRGPGRARSGPAQRPVEPAVGSSHGQLHRSRGPYLGDRSGTGPRRRLLTLPQLDQYAGCSHQRRRARRMIRAERRMTRAERSARFGRQSFALALGSMLVTLPVTAIVLKGSPGVAAIMLMALIWVIIGIINVAYAVRKHPQSTST